MRRLPPEPQRKKDSDDRIYPCVYGLTDNCPVRKLYKLKPESLEKFCANCPILAKEKPLLIKFLKNGNSKKSPKK